MGCKAAETVTSSITHMAQKLLNECTAPQWFKKFCKGDKSREDKECNGQLWEGDNDQLRAIIEADPLKTAGEVSHSMVIQHLNQIGKVKKLDKQKPYELTANQKTLSFEIHNYYKPFLSKIVMCDEKWILDDSRR